VGRAEGAAHFYGRAKRRGAAKPHRARQTPKKQRTGNNTTPLNIFVNLYTRQLRRLKVSEGEAERSFQDVETSDTGPCETGT
jgi:hypothetical protein